MDDETVGIHPVRTQAGAREVALVGARAETRKKISVDNSDAAELSEKSGKSRIDLEGVALVRFRGGGGGQTVLIKRSRERSRQEWRFWTVRSRWREIYFGYGALLASLTPRT